MLGCGIIYMLFVGKHLLPDHPEESLTDEFAIRKYLSPKLSDSPRS
jgi:hypothetical protein